MSGPAINFESIINKSVTTVTETGTQVIDGVTTKVYATTKTATQGITDIMSNPANLPNVTLAAGVETAESSIDGLMGGNVPDYLSSSISSAFGKVKSAGTAAVSFAGTEMESMKTKLPIMSAVSNVQKQGEALSGQMSGTGCGGLISEAFNGLKEIGNEVTKLQNSVDSAVTNFTNKVTAYVTTFGEDAFRDLVTLIPEKFEIDPTTLKPTAVISEAYTSFMDGLAPAKKAVLESIDELTTGLENKASEIGTFISTETAAAAGVVTTGIQLLKDNAFAAFATTTNNPCVQSILTQVMPAPSASSAVDKMVMSAAAGAQSKVTNLTAPVAFSPSKVSLIPSIGDPVLISKPKLATPSATESTSGSVESLAMRKVIATAMEQLESYQDTIVKPKLKNVNDWKTANNYDQVYADAYASLDDKPKQDAFKALRSEFRNSQVFIEYDFAVRNYTKGKDQMKKDSAVCTAWMESGVPTVTPVLVGGALYKRKVVWNETTTIFGDFTMASIDVITVTTTEPA